MMIHETIACNWNSNSLKQYLRLVKIILSCVARDIC